MQRLMGGAVMRALSSKGGMQSKWRDGRAMKRVAAEFIKPNDRLSSFERLEIYNRQYWYRLKDCFYDDYPGLRALMGDGRFEKMTIAYLDEHPSASFTLRNLGGRLVSFLESHPKWTAGLKEAMLDMARLEWAHIEAFDSTAEPVLTTDMLLECDPGELRLVLQPYVTLLELGCAADKFLLDAQRERDSRGETSNAVEAPRRRGRGAAKRKLKREKVYLAVHRYQESVYYKRLEPAQYQLLKAFRDGASFEAACSELAAAHAQDGELLNRVRDWFANWASLGWFCVPGGAQAEGAGKARKRGKG